MVTIDQRVLITVPAQAVWDVIRDITKNPSWQVDCESVSFITPRREGRGVRWRYATGTGHECVVETTAWYDRIGYEYHFVDGMPFKQNFGRLRLQEIPEGTIVQWTFSYEPAGMFSGRRVGRQLEAAIEENLATLKKNFSQSRGQARVFESKSLMQDAPDVENREHYKPRHPSQMSNRPQANPNPPHGAVIIEPPIESGDLEPFTPVRSAPQPVQRITEPPIEQSDTRPRPAVQVPPPRSDEWDESRNASPSRLDERAVSPRIRIPDVPIEEPDFLSDFAAIRATEERAAIDLARFEPPISQEDTKPTSAIKPVTDSELKATSAATLESAAVQPPMPTIHATIEHQPVSPPAEPAKPTLEVPRAQPTEPVDRDATPVVKLPELISQSKPEPAEPPKAESPSAQDDTGTKSIWDVFGVPRPSETSEVAAAPTIPTAESAQVVSDEPTAKEAIPEAPSRPTASEIATPTIGDTTTYMLITGRMGLRARRRRDMARLRRPPS